MADLATREDELLQQLANLAQDYHAKAEPIIAELATIAALKPPEMIYIPVDSKGNGIAGFRYDLHEHKLTVTP